MTISDSVAAVELTITPADTIRTGDTVVFTCEVPSKGFLDLVRIVKYIEEENRKVVSEIKRTSRFLLSVSRFLYSQECNTMYSVICKTRNCNQPINHRQEG